VNRDAMVKLVYQGLGIPAIGPLPPNVWGARSDVVTYPYDPPRARKLLAEAGWQGDREAPLKLFAPSAASQYMPAPARVAGIIKRCLGEVGISVDVILSEPADHQRALWAGEHDLALHGWFNDNGDPDNFLYTLLDSDNTTGTRPSNIAFYSNAWFHDVIGMAQRTTDPKESDRAHGTRAAVFAGPGDPGDRRPLGAARALEGRVRAAERAARAGWCNRRPWASTAGRSTRDEPSRRKSGQPRQGGRRQERQPRQGEAIRPSLNRKLRSSSGNIRQSSIFRAAEWLGRGASVWSLPVSAVMRRHGLRRRLSAVLIIAALGPVIAVSVVAVALIFSSVEQGIEFEAVRGLQVARGLFLQQVQTLAAGAAELGDDVGLLRAQATAPHAARQRLGELSLKMPSALFETTDATGRVIARCTHGSCEDAPSAAAGALEPSDRSPVILRALGYERTVSVERARDRLVVRAAFAARGSGDADARDGRRHGGDRRLRRRSPEGRSGRGTRGGGLRGRRSERVDLHGGHRRSPRGPAAAPGFHHRRPGHRDDGRAARGREPSLFGRAGPAPGT
jgi:hypothetical protein